MHKVVTLIQQGIHIPIIHIAEATAQKLQQEHIQKVALLGTKYTMTQMFYKQKMCIRDRVTAGPHQVVFSCLKLVTYIL